MVTIESKDHFDKINFIQKFINIDAKLKSDHMVKS